MIEEKRILVQAWLTKAASDLRSARILAAETDPPLDTAIYHRQQPAEKAVKGFLVFHDTRFEKTHDIRVLGLLAASIEPRFHDWQHAAQLLTPYVHRFRYPSDVGEPKPDEFKQALATAGNLYTFVLSLLPTGTHPQAANRQ
jgi:HEPN domain-containing protein